MASAEISYRARLSAQNSITVGLMYLLAGVFALSAQTGKVPVLRQRPTPTTPASPSPAKAVSSPATHTAILPIGLPLRIQLDHRYRMRQGEMITGRLIDPVYFGDHIVLPKNTVVHGTITRLQPIGKGTRTWSLLDGDVTPLKQPVLTFTALQLPGGQRLPITADATERTAGVVKMSGPQGKQSLVGKVKTQVETKKKSVENVIHSDHKSDLAIKYVYGQLPYHPQDIWAGTQFDAELEQPLTVPDPNSSQKFPISPPQGHIPPGTLDARLVTTISSATNKVGNPIVAVLTQPYFNASKTTVILPTGTRLMGVVTQAKPARKLGRNGTLRFTFRQIELPSGALQEMHGQMTAVEGANGQNLTVDSEGGAKANSAQGKFLAPLLLGALASNSLDSDQGAVHSGVSSNGFGLAVRIVALAVVTPAVTAGFAYYALGKSVTRRWLMPGQNVVFAKNTRMELSVADR
jgi:hypothetical protein